MYLQCFEWRTQLNKLVDLDIFGMFFECVLSQTDLYIRDLKQLHPVWVKTVSATRPTKSVSRSRKSSQIVTVVTNSYVDLCDPFP